VTDNQPNSTPEVHLPESDSPTRKGDRTRSADIKSFGDLIAFAYGQKGKRFPVPATALKSLPQGRGETPDGDSDRDPWLDLILRYSRSDPLLLATAFRAAVIRGHS
jgi:hypothetical protein